MKPWELLGRATTPDGSWLELRHHDGEYVIRADTYDLMTSRNHGSEVAMASLACAKPRPDMRVLVGGLGMGYTLRAVLDLLPSGGSVVVSELVPEVIEWNRGPLGPLAGNPLDDDRVTLVAGDVADTIRSADRVYDAILLDVDNGPSALTQRGNGRLYGPQGLAAGHRALRPGGTLAVWSVELDPVFEARLVGAAFKASSHRVKSFSARHVIILGQALTKRPPRPESGRR